MALTVYRTFSSALAKMLSQSPVNTLIARDAKHGANPTIRNSSGLSTLRKDTLTFGLEQLETEPLIF